MLPSTGGWSFFQAARGSLDDEPVFGMIGHIFPPHHRALPGLKMRTWELTYRAAHHIATETDGGGWTRIARMDRITAAQVVNRATLFELHRDCRPRQ